MEKILIVDDSTVQASQLKSILKDDYDVSVAQTAEEGMNCAVTGEFSLILLDVVMPDMDGFMLLRALQEEDRTRHIPVIMITSLSDSESEQRGLTLGAVDYIAKPFNPMIVKARVNTHIKLYQYRRQVEYQSMTDQLTGIANRRRHDRHSLMKWQDATRLKVPFSLCIFDIDCFKQYNDTYGHPAGDRVIAEVAATISSFLRRSTDFLARYGGEEFVAIMVNDPSDKAFPHVQHIRQAVEAMHIPHESSISDWVTVSVGGATVLPQVGDTYAAYLKIADTMLYDAKRFGRNQVVWVDEKMQQLCEK